MQYEDISAPGTNGVFLSCLDPADGDTYAGVMVQHHYGITIILVSFADSCGRFVQ